MIQIDGVSIGQVTYLIGFKKPDDQIRFKQAEAEKAFSTFFSSQSSQTNIPDEVDPNAPRIMFSSARKALAISQAACQADFKFEASSIDRTKQFDEVKKNVAEFQERAFKFKPKDEYALHALIIHLQMKSSSGKDALHDYIFDQFFKVPRIGQLASVGATIGFQLDQKFLNFGANVYELRKLDMRGAPGMQTSIDLSEVPIVEEGIAFKIDVNNLPEVSADKKVSPEGVEVLFDIAEKFIQGDLPTMSGLSFFD